MGGGWGVHHDPQRPPGWPPPVPPISWGGPGWPGGPPAPRRSRARWLIPLVLVLALLTGAGGTGLFLLLRSTDGPANAVRAYLMEVRDSRYEAAYVRLCPSVQERRPASEFAIIMRALDDVQGGIASFAVRRVQIHRSVGSPTVREVQVDVRRGSAAASHETYQVGKESGSYCLLTPGAPFSLDPSLPPDLQQPGPFDDSPGDGRRGGGDDEPPVRTA
ncbi:hypothetical protein [Frankia sp. B2]|uniref:hypothetical protein n=1 Tax=Frankia sp. B2 TaxID=2541730 RepID=UPI00106B8650|nr:hypothetical protein [Frankia sp. B2]